MRFSGFAELIKKKRVDRQPTAVLLLPYTLRYESDLILETPDMSETPTWQISGHPA